MKRRSGFADVLCAAALLVCAVSPLNAQKTAQPEITRVSATLNGVFSPRGYFNILVPLNHMRGASAAKLDLKSSQIIVDFSEGAPVSEAQIRAAIVDAGYRPGNVEIRHLPERQASERGAGWIRIKHPQTKNPFMSWLEENF